jgi:uncharacterized membrane protein YhhN
VEDLTVPIALFMVAVGAALVGAEKRRKLLLAVAKPVATLSLLGVAWRGQGQLEQPVALVLTGILLSAVGDIALVFEGERAFVLGLVLFLGTHLAYVAAFVLGGAGEPWTPLVGVLVFGASSGWLVSRLWLRVRPALRVPLLIYAATITAMVASAFASLTGNWPPAAAAAAAGGALLFYFSDANLAWNRFVQPYPHGHTVTLWLYWTGQLGIALALRWSAG